MALFWLAAETTAQRIAQLNRLAQSRTEMAFSKGYRDFVVEQLERVAPVTAKSMFGGVGLYAQGLFFALIAENRLYFKVDDATRPDFERLGMEPFRPFGEENAMGYYEVPADVLEDAARLEPWMRKAIEVAARAGAVIALVRFFRSSGQRAQA